MGFLNRNSTKGSSSPSESSDAEKHYQKHNYGQAVAHDDDFTMPQLQHTTEAKLIRKIDLRVVPVLTILYLLAFLDRINIANAQVFDLSKDLNLEGTQYNTALVIFFVPYILFEIPSNIFLKKLKPHVWLSGCMFAFCLVSLCQGFTTSFGGLLAARFFLGLTETGMLPGCAYLIGMWYKREEAQKRITFFFSSATLAGAFGGLLASAIGKMEGLRGYSGWRWIFILEGLLTCVVSIVWYFLIADFPEDAKWLTDSERAWVKARMEVDQGRSAIERPTTMRDVGNFFKDYKVLLGALIYFGLIVPGYGYAYFSPTIIQTYGYSPIQTQLHSVPPWAAAWVFAMLVAAFSDRLRHRMAFILFDILIAISGLGVLLTVRNNTKVQYAALFLVAMGTYSAMSLSICWFQQNLGGHHRRAIGSAWQIGFGNIGAIIAVYVFLKKDSPNYVTGYAVCVAWCCLSFMSCAAYGGACWAQNRERNRMPKPVEAFERHEEWEKGDLAVGYRYLV